MTHSVAGMTASTSLDRRALSGASISTAERLLIVIATVIVMPLAVIVALRSSAEPAVLVLRSVLLGAFGAIAVVLSVIDIKQHRLPDRITLPAAGGVLLGIGAIALLERDPAPLVRAAIGAAALCALLVVLALVRPGSLGGGDVKLGLLIGTVTGWLSWGAIVVALCASFIIGGAVALVLVVTRRATARTRIAFGPPLLVGAWCALLATPFLLPL